MNKAFKKYKRGFTIIESLVAISLLVISIAGPLSLAARGIGYSNYARDEITAFYLANEALDTIRYIRDTNTTRYGAIAWLDLPGSQGGKMLDSLTQVYYFDVWQDPIQLQDLGNDDFRQKALLKICKTSEGVSKFGYFNGGGDCLNGIIEDSVFSRKVTLKPVNYSTDDPPRPSEIEVTVTVVWTAANGIEREVSVTENLFNLINT